MSLNQTLKMLQSTLIRVENKVSIIKHNLGKINYRSDIHQIGMFPTFPTKYNIKHNSGNKTIDKPDNVPVEYYT